MGDAQLDGALERIYDLLLQRDYLLEVSRVIASTDEGWVRLKLLAELEAFVQIVKS